MAVPDPLPGGRTAGAEQQPGRAQYKALRHWPEELPFRQHPAGGQGQRSHLQPGRNRQRKWLGPLPISALDSATGSKAGMLRQGLGGKVAAGVLCCTSPNVTKPRYLQRVCLQARFPFPPKRACPNLKILDILSAFVLKRRIVDSCHMMDSSFEKGGPLYDQS